MTNPDGFPAINWDVAPDSYEIEGLRDMARLPLWEKLEWLEEMQLFAEWMQEQRRQRLAIPNTPNE